MAPGTLKNESTRDDNMSCNDLLFLFQSMNNELMLNIFHTNIK
jgi:hypothetical protein